MLVQGLDTQSTHHVCIATVVCRLTYAAPAWWGFTSAEDRQRLQAVLNRAIRWTLYSSADPSIGQVCRRFDEKLFSTVLNSSDHVLHSLLPPVKSTSYNLRQRAHNRELPLKTGPFIDKNFIIRMLYPTGTEY